MIKNQLKKIRLEVGLTQAQLSKESGVSKQYIAQLEQTLINPGIDIGERLAKALSVDPDRLFFRENFGSDRIAYLGDLYSEKFLEITPEARESIILYILSMDSTAYKVFSRGRMPWNVLVKNALAFDEWMKRFPKRD